MPKRRARITRSEPACPRCGNEQDLREWFDGRVYCLPCIDCPHGEIGHSGVCTTCVRQLHTVMTFDGPRIVDINYYIAEAWREYSIDIGELLVWTYAEHGLINTFYSEEPRPKSFGVIAPPPHHRITSSDENR